MRKIISILVALGLVLAFSAVAMPTAGAACTATVVVTPACAGTGAVYNITFTSPVTLLPVNDLLSVDFGAGTTFAATFTAADILVDGIAAPSVVKSGTHIEFPIPATHATILPATSVNVVISDVINPGVGSYQLGLDYKLTCCPAVVFDCASYTIIPATSTYDFFWDSNPTYPGIKVGFIPPFKACGQNIPGAYEFDGKYANLFDLILKPTLVGCNGPCTLPVLVTLWVSAAPTGAKISLGLNNTGAITHNLTAANNATNPVVVGNFTLGNNTTITWDNIIHFDTIGDYTICVKAFCPPGAASCETGCNPQGVTVADECFNIKVYQWKDVGKIILDEKWNLISLPLVPFSGDIASLLASLPADAIANLVSIHHYDRTGCAATGTWKVYGNGQSSLTTMEDGKSYWVRMLYPLTGNYTWYVFGTALPMPPSAPREYAVCQGWNMLGFTSLVNDLESDYLWNWSTAQPVVYGWNNTGDWATSGWQFVPWAGNLVTGQGYWAAFSKAGSVFVPGP